MKNLKSYLATLPDYQKQHGGHSDGDIINLKAGYISVIYQKGSLRYLSVNGREIIRMIYSAVRDKDWLTIEPVISGEVFEIKKKSFRIEYNCLYQSGSIDFSAHYTIEGRSDSSLIFSLEGEAMDTFEKSRIGFCLLHPVEGCSGKPCIITHSKGSSETLTFPVYISPDQVFTDIKSMEWHAEGTECTVIFSGEIFETEDQRNWTDASYKTYCTPVDLPCPATIRKGEKISQRIEFCTTVGDVVKTLNNEEINITLDPFRSSAMPLIGTGRSSRTIPLSGNEIKILKELSFDHYRIDLYLFRPAWSAEANIAAKEAKGLNCSLELALFFDENFQDQLEDLIKWIGSLNPGISVISLFHKSEAVISDPILNTIGHTLKRILPGVRIGYGTNANFAQINRNVTGAPVADYLCYSVHPQEHASDNITLIENLQGQSYTVESAMQFAGGKGIWISPVNIKRRFNANIENYENPASDDVFPPQADSRLMSLFGACWTAGSIKYLSGSGARGITFFETAGERGIIQGDLDSRWPSEFKTVKGMIFPVYHLFRWLMNDRSFRLMHGTSSRPLMVDCLALSNGTQIKMAVSNYTSSKQKTLIHGFSGETKIKILNAQSYSEAVNDINWIEKNWKNGADKGELVLDPFALAFIEGTLISHGVTRSITE
jgi:hypothetical protein